MVNYADHQLTARAIAKGLTFDGKGNLETMIDEKRARSSIRSVFNWTVTLVSGENDTAVTDIDPLWITDGNDISDGLRRSIERLSDLSSFDFHQFSVEHSRCKSHVMVRAGAGTGKTSTMILRVAYLCYQEQIPPAELSQRLMMITFTNEATRNMKVRLKRWFENYYLLTKRINFLHMAAQVDGMQISTIHAFARKLIETLGVEEGYGKHVVIASGEYQRRVLIEKELETYVAQHGQEDLDYLGRLGIRVYELRDTVAKMILGLQNKSIDVASLAPERFGTATGHEEFHKLLSTVITETEQKYERQLLESNAVDLGRLMPVLSKLVSNFPERLQKVLGPGYLFVDEFQDTDDVQIDVLLQICAAANLWLFVVGDVKQCIYRFRGAEEKAFDHLHRENDPDHWITYDLVRNYRTDKRLLDAYQGHFRRWAQPNLALLTYGTEDELRGTVGPVEDDPPLCHRIEVDDESQRLPAMFEEIQRWRKRIQTGYLGGFSIQERTIAILVRENWQTQAVVDAGRKLGCPIETKTGGDLYQSVPAADLAVLLQALEYQGCEQLGRFLASNFMPVGYSRSYLLGLRNARYPEGQAFRTVQKAYLISRIDAVLASSEDAAYKDWASILASLRTVPVLQVIRRLYTQLRPWAQFERTDARKGYYRSNVDLLLEKILQHQKMDGLSLAQLTRFVVTNIVTRRAEESRSPLATSGEDVRIVCVTVHSAKGLEYGRVILPYASDSFDRHNTPPVDVMSFEDGRIGYQITFGDRQTLVNDYFDANREQAERRKEETRILYVAMTRAIYAFAWIDVRNELSNGQSWQTLLRGAKA